MPFEALLEAALGPLVLVCLVLLILDLDGDALQDGRLHAAARVHGGRLEGLGGRRGSVGAARGLGTRAMARPVGAR